ncbi:MAG: hypothetical protein JXQ73_14630 [Phycisphaerae bacterium]|nr:hypothetical protein [Phycisphaerae bacterium]
MGTRTRKTFDCVAMKREIQQHLLQEYEASRDQYESYWHFLQETNRRSPALLELRRKLGLAASPTDR